MDRVYENEYFHLRTFEDLLYDAVYTAYLADDIDDERDDHGHQFTLARCSVLNTVLLFECGANCCLDALKLSGSYLDDVDKLPYLSKYEYFLSRVRPDLPFDRGC